MGTNKTIIAATMAVVAIVGVAREVAVEVVIEVFKIDSTRTATVIITISKNQRTCHNQL